MIGEPVATWMVPAQAIATAAQCTKDEDEGWRYQARIINEDADKAQHIAVVDVFDAEGVLLGQL